MCVYAYVYVWLRLLCAENHGMWIGGKDNPLGLKTAARGVQRQQLRWRHLRCRGCGGTRLHRPYNKTRRRMRRLSSVCRQPPGPLSIPTALTLPGPHRRSRP